MLKALIRFSLTQRLMVMLAGVGIIIGGYLAFEQLPIDAFPDISSPQVQVIIKVPGLSPSEIESRVTRPIELEMQGIPNQRIMRSITKYSLSVVTIDFNDDADIYWARQQVSERLTGVWGELPANAEGGLAPITSPLGEIYMYRVKADGLDNKELRNIQDWIIRPRLRTVDGVADVNSLGGEVQSFEVVVNPEALVRYWIDLDDVVEALKANNRNTGGDRISKEGAVILVRSVGKLNGIKDINNITVKTLAGGQPVRIKDVANVKISALTRYGGVTADGKGEIVTGLVLLRKKANTKATVDGVKQEIELLKPTLPTGVTIEPFYDRTDLIKAAVNTVKKSLGEAIVLVIIVLIIMLGHMRSALVVASALPLSVLLTFILMQVFGVSANLMSLGGIAIAIGILVDSSIVVVENIVTQLQHANKNVSKLHLIYRAVTEVSVPVVSGVVIIIIVFMPLFSLTGLEAKMFTPLAVTISFAMAGALVLSLTVVPAIASLFIKHVDEHDGRLLAYLKNAYRPMVQYALSNRKRAVSIAVVLLVASLVLSAFIGKEFMPTMDEGTTVVIIEKEPNITLEDSLAFDEKTHKAMMEVPEVTGVTSRTGADELRLDPMDLFQTDNFIITKPRSEWKISVREFEEKIREKLASFKDLDIAFTQPIDMRVSEMLTGVRGAMAIKLFGDDLDILNKLGEEIETLTTAIPGAVDVFRTRLSGQKYLQISLNSDSMANNGVVGEDINRLIELAIGGQVVTEIVDGARSVGVVVRYPEEYRSTSEAISNLQVKGKFMSKIPLRELAEIKEIEGPFQITRESGKRLVVVQANVENRDVVGFVDEIKKKIEDKIKIPKGYYITYGGQFENQQRAEKRLALVIPMSIALIFLILFITFRSARQALLILLNIPFAMIGGIFALFISGLYLSVPASVGFIALFGVAIMNGVVMVTYFNQLRESGKDILSAVREGTERRLRPVLMTASIAILGLLPLLLAAGPGSELQRPLSVVVIGGTITSTILTLILLPTIYAWLETCFEAKAKLQEKKI